MGHRSSGRGGTPAGLCSHLAERRRDTCRPLLTFGRAEEAPLPASAHIWQSGGGREGSEVRGVRREMRGVTRKGQQASLRASGFGL